MPMTNKARMYAMKETITDRVQNNVSVTYVDKYDIHFASNYKQQFQLVLYAVNTK